MRLDTSKKVFIAPSCLTNSDLLVRIYRILMDYKFPKVKIFEDINMDFVASGDYLIRCISGNLEVFEIQLTLPFGLTTKLIGNL